MNFFLFCGREWNLRFLDYFEILDLDFGAFSNYQKSFQKISKNHVFSDILKIRPAVTPYWRGFQKWTFSKITNFFVQGQEFLKLKKIKNFFFQNKNFQLKKNFVKDFFQSQTFPFSKKIVNFFFENKTFSFLKNEIKKNFKTKNFHFRKKFLKKISDFKSFNFEKKVLKNSLPNKSFRIEKNLLQKSLRIEKSDFKQKSLQKTKNDPLKPAPAGRFKITFSKSSKVFDFLAKNVTSRKFKYVNNCGRAKKRKNNKNENFIMKIELSLFYSPCYKHVSRFVRWRGRPVA